MLKILHAKDRGHTNLGWLQSAHSFSFGRYQNPNYMGFGPLRVINEDKVAGSGGFNPHNHANMEIVSLVLAGALKHQDSLGNASHILPNEIQLMSAGSGIEHSEMNASQTEPVHFLQIWVQPHQKNTTPSYQQKSFLPYKKLGQPTLLLSPDGANNSLKILADVHLSLLELTDNTPTTLTLSPKKLYWLQMISGVVNANNQLLKNGDGLAITHEENLQLNATAASSLLLFEMAT